MSEKGGEEESAPVEPEDVSKVGKSSSLLDHVEKTLADNYRKEIDQEENVWRTLPFFAAILALEVTAMVQLRTSIMAANGPIAYVMGLLSILIAAGNLAALWYLSRSIAKANFKYIAPETEILKYAAAVENAAREGALMAGESATTTVKRFLARQYAATTENNREINQYRASKRTSAGLIILWTVLGTLILGALTVVVPSPKIGDSAVTPSGGSNADRSSSVSPAPPSVACDRAATGESNADPSPSPGGVEGVVHPSPENGNGGTSGEGK